MSSAASSPPPTGASAVQGSVRGSVEARRAMRPVTLSVGGRAANSAYTALWPLPSPVNGASTAR